MVQVSSVLVTGGSGFIGSRIVQHLHEKYPQCVITILDTQPPQSHYRDNVQIKYVQVDITSRLSVHKALLDVRPQAVIHTAAVVPPLSERYLRRMQQVVDSVNVDGTRNIVDAAQNAGTRAFVYTSSCTAVTDNLSRSYPNVDERWPTVEIGKASIYGESKAQAEKLVTAANTAHDETSQNAFSTCCLRVAIAFGEGDYQLVPSIVNLIDGRHESVFRLGDGMNMWDTVYVGNVADAHILALENLLSDRCTAAGETFFIQNNEPVSVRDFMLFVWKEFNGHIPPFCVPVPTSLGWFIGVVAEIYTLLTGRPATISRGSITDATATRYASGEKARRILGYEPRVSLEEGLRRSCREYAARKGNSERTNPK